MPIAPQQDWAHYEGRSQESDAERLRTMSPQEKFAVYADMFNILWTARQKIPGDWKRLEEHRWQEKLAIRQRMVESFRKLDEWRRERAAADNSG